MCRVLFLSAILVMLADAACAAQESLLPAGAELTSEKDLEALSERALGRLMRGEIEGFEELQSHGVPSGDKERSSHFFRSMAEQFKEFSRKGGAPLGCQLIARRKAGDSLRQYVYLGKYEKNVLRWVFTYYRPKERWLFFRVDFDGNVNALFEDAEDSDMAPPHATPGIVKP